MRKLNLMLFREIARSKGQFIAVAAVIFSGITMFVATFMSYRNLKNSLDSFYQKYGFLDYYAEAAAITPGVVNKVRRLNGVLEACGRIRVDVAADMGIDKRVTVRLISLPDRERPAVNNLCLLSGRYFGAGSDGCLVDRKFAEFYKLKEWDTLKLVINKHAHEFRVRAVVSSPEFIYAMKSAASFIPSAEDFGIAYIKESTAESILGYNDAYNELHLRFAAGADAEAVIDRVERILKPYGFIRGVKREDQLSHSMVKNEIEQLEQMAWMFPAIFLIVAAIIIYIMQKRAIMNQRTLIGVMKAFGYGERRVLGHYLLYSLLVAAAGTLPAIGVGWLVGTALTNEYNQIFNIPVLRANLGPDILLIGLSLSVGFCLLAGFNASKRVLAIRPAQALRSEAPLSAKRILIERIQFFWKRLSFSWKMSLRNIFRNPQRTAFTVLGMAFTVMFLLITLFFFDSIDYVFKQHFLILQNQDYKAVFAEPASYQDALELRSIRGIRKVEPVLEVPAQLKRGWIKRETVMVGVADDITMLRMIGADGKPVAVPEQGILLAGAIADKLGVKAGDRILLKIFQGEMKEKEVTIAGVVKQYAGFNCYMNINALGDLLGEGRYATGALLRVERGLDGRVLRELYKYPGIENVEGRLKTYRSFLELLEFNNFFFGIMLLFGAVMGFAIIFNTTLINIMERRRELASLKVLGFTRREIEIVIVRENLLMTLTALLPGLVFGRAVAEFLAKQLSADHLFAFEIVLYPRTYILTLLGVFLFVLLAHWANGKNISGLNMVEVLKNQEL